MPYLSIASLMAVCLSGASTTPTCSAGVALTRMMRQVGRGLAGFFMLDLRAHYAWPQSTIAGSPSFKFAKCACGTNWDKA